MIIAITDRKISAASDFLEQLEAVVASEPDMIILREKDVSEAGYRYLAIECMRICSGYSVKFCVNSFTKIAAALRSTRVQVSFGSLKNNIGKMKDFEEIWVSVHSAAEAEEAERMGATHLIYGNIFETSCKPGAEGRGTEDLRRVCGTVRIPVFAVGGINADNAGRAMDAGCAGVCVRSALMEAKTPSLIMKDLREKVRK
ncbi:MAG: thiamine phosphate synthase [Candidatus Methanoplasma sp.]|jgi:thiamine-phosphate pyrophosphorylase|nr:thiamine phosphate synthase [Candidatus Methanoplasma sp.]